MHAWLEAVLLRELDTLEGELSAYPSDDEIWATPPGVTNSAGTLVAHLAGNLQHYVGAMLGGTGYRRDRPAEFGGQRRSRRELLAEIDRARGAVKAGLGGAALPDLAAPFPEVVGGWRVATGDFLLHLVSHTGYHLGQIDYHRRLVGGDAKAVSAVPIGALRTAVEARPQGP